MAEPTEIRGTCDERFARVREVFSNAFKDGLEVGAAVSIVVDGERVVDLWSGWMDADRTRPWQRALCSSVANRRAPAATLPGEENAA